MQSLISLSNDLHRCFKFVFNSCRASDQDMLFQSHVSSKGQILLQHTCKIMKSVDKHFINKPPIFIYPYFHQSTYYSAIIIMEPPVDKKVESPQETTKDRKRKYQEKNGSPNQEKRERPQKQERQEKHDKHEKHEKHERAEKHDRPQRPERKEREKVKHQYEYNADLITDLTEIPPLPKKNEEKKKPERQEYIERQNKLRQKINKLKDRKQQIKNEKFQPVHKVVKGQDNNYDEFRNKIDEVQDIREKLREVKKRRDALRERFQNLIEDAKNNNNLIKDLKDALKGSRENVRDEIQRLEHRLTTATLTKEEERQLNIDIMTKKRIVGQAESNENFQTRLDQAEDRRDLLSEQIDQIKEEKQPLENEYKELKAEIDSKNTDIDKTKTVLNNETTEKSKAREANQKEWKEWKENKKKRQEEIQQQIDKLEQQIDKIWDNYHLQSDEYYKQKHYIDYIKWQAKIKEKKINDKIYEAKKLQYLEKQKERDKEEILKKHISQIELCNYLEQYCKSLYPQEEKGKAEGAKVEDIDLNQKLTEDSQWKKQKGLQVIQSKKDKVDQQPARKKGKNYKKPKEEVKEKKFEVPFNMQVQFEKIKVLAPESVEDIQRAIRQLKEREQLFKRACSEDVSEQDKNKIAQIKSRNAKGKHGGRKEQEEEFPVL